MLLLELKRSKSAYSGWPLSWSTFLAFAYGNDPSICRKSNILLDLSCQRQSMDVIMGCFSTRRLACGSLGILIIEGFIDSPFASHGL